MDLDSQSMTPPSSPIIGYSGCDDEQSLIDSGVVYCLNCKGAPRANDFSFNSDSYILRREVISAVANLRTGNLNYSEYKPKLLKCFGYHFDPLDQEQIKQMMLVCRKSVSSLEVISESTHSFSVIPQNYDISSISDDPEDLSNQNPWTLRKNVCQFLNVIVRGLKYYRIAWKAEELCGLFEGLKRSLVPIKDWSSQLKTHCGFRSGNECSAAVYHFFHLQLELRWSLFLIFGATPAMVNWLLEDLMQLAWYTYTTDSKLALNEKQPFNCMCVKEIWTMVRLVIEHLKPDSKSEKPFWNIYSEAMQRFPGSDPYFSIWLTSHLAQISDYNIAGVHCPGQGRVESKQFGNNASNYVHSVFKDWASRGGRSAEILKLSINLFQYWGGDCEILVFLWAQWVPRLNGENDGFISNLESYSNIDKWMKLISQISESSAKLCGNSNEDDEIITRLNLSRGGSSSSSVSRCLGSNNDPFLEFVYLVAAYSRWATIKEIKKLISNICRKLTGSNYKTKDYREIGIIRVTSLFMALATVIESDREAVTMCERLQDVFVYGEGKNTPGRRKAILRGYSCMIIVLLKKNVNLTSNPGVTSLFMKTVDDLLCQGSSADNSRKDLVMVYLDMLESLPKHTPALCSRADLGRQSLISLNLSMWFTNAGHNNYVVRTARCLSQITEWIVKWITDTNVFTDPSSSPEGKELSLRISEKSLSFLKTIVLLNSSRIPSTDVEPIAFLAADITLLTRIFKKTTEEYDTNFDLFALHERTCPLVSQFFVQRLLRSREFVEDKFAEDRASKVKWTQTWIRLVALECSVPDELTEMVLANGFSSTSNQELLRKFCKKADELDKEHVQNCLNPLVLLLNGVISSTLFKEEQGHRDVVNIVNAVINSSTLVLKHMNFDKLYIRGNPNSVMHKILDIIAPPSWPSKPPWEKFSKPVLNCLEKNLYYVFEVVALQPGMAHEQYLCRKLQDIVVFAYFGFTHQERIDRNEHPAMKIHDLSEANSLPQVQNQILPNAIAGDHVVKDLKLCQLFLSVVNIFRTNQLANAVMRVLAGVIRAYLIHFNSKDKLSISNSCMNAIVYCCLVGSSHSPLHTKLAADAFKSAFEKEFDHRSRIVFQLCLTISRSKNCTNGKLDARRFLKFEVLPLLKSWVEKCEARRGIGTDKSLRDPLEMLEREMANVQKLKSS